MKKKLLAIDGNSILNRAFYGIRPLTTKDGFSTNALYGMVTMITKQADLLKPDYCAVAFDLKAPTFRHKLFDAYKAGRRPMPEELKMQFPVAKELMQTFGYHVLELEGYEADDILGTLGSLAEGEDVEAYLMTGDRDALQLIDDHVHVLLATNAETIDMDEAKFFEKYGVKSSQFVDVKALMGDSSDNIPGVPGIGEKTALKLIADFGTLDGVYQSLPTATHTPSVRKKLEEGKENAYLSKELATICKTVPLGISLSDLKNDGIRKEEAKRLLMRLEFSAFIKRFDLIEEKRQNAESAECKFLSLDEALDLYRDASRIAVFLGEDTVWIDDGKTYALVSSDLSGLLPILDGKEIVCHDAKAIFKRFGGGLYDRAKWFDLMLAAYLVNPDKNHYAPETLVSDYLGELLPDGDCGCSFYLSLQKEISARLRESGQEKLLYEIEMPLSRVLAEMETAGFLIDREGIAHYGEDLTIFAKSLEERIWFRAGERFNINSPKQLGDVLFESLKLPHAKKTKTGYSTNAEILEKLRPYHPIIEDVLDYRQVTKLKGTYVDGLLKVADENGRVHSSFNQTATATGRLSSSEPNLQNIPIRTETGRELRKYFLPKNKDYVIIDADYSQIELRLLAHISDDRNMIKAFRSGADIHTSTAATVFSVSEKEVTGEMRKKAKAVNFGILYGIGAFSLADDLHVSRVQAQEYIDNYLSSYPGIQNYLTSVIKDAYENGYVATMFGRRRYIPELSGNNKMLRKFGERVAMNSPIQGSAADIIKLAMIRVDEKLRKSGIDARLILQVHDELLLEARRDVANEAAKILREEMEQVFSCKVPLSVDLHIGNNWFDAK